MKILVIEDHPKIRENIITYLSIKGYTTEWAVHGAEALEKIHANYDIIILDVNMPIMDGRKFLETIRANGVQCPVITLTSNSMIDDKLEIFDLGADDYMTKPFDMRELEARIIALARRKEKTIEEFIEIGPYTIDTAKHLVKQWEEVMEISNKEFWVLEFLGRNKWYPKSKASILEAVWGMREESLNFNSITLEAHISTIRKKLGKDIIETIKWVWYQIN